MANETTEWKPKHNPWIVCIPIMMAAFMFVLDETIANVALPYMAGSFSVSRQESTWVLTSYLIASGIVIPSVGFFCKLMGRKNFFIFSVILFTVSSFLCGIANSLPMMVITRVLQGFGGGAVLPLAQSITLEMWPVEKRAQSMALFGMVVVIAPIIGPVLGGWITSNWSWPFIYFINIPIGIACVFFAKQLIEDPPYARKQENVKMDTLGFYLLIGWLTCMQIVLDKGNDADWFGSTWVCWMTFFAVTFALSFFIVQAKKKDSLIDITVFKDKNFLIGTLVQVVMMGVLLASLAILPQFLQGLMGYDAYLSGLAMMPRGMGAMLTIFTIGAIGNKINEKYLVIFGLILLSISGFMLCNLNLQIATINIAIPNFIMGIAMSMCMIPIITLSTATLTQSQMTNASGVQNLLKNLGGAIGTSIVTTLISRKAQAHQTFLVDNMTMLNDNFAQRFHAYQAQFQAGLDSINAGNMANTMLYKQMLQQANMGAFRDTFEFCAIACVIIIPLVFLIKGIDKKKGNLKNS
ncbi:MAG: DHA2 family efflux MFS transporter permease subunit [Candidatus Gastranaerophilales bacterium]|nr:DHA2 family efflux MFS transporter permease subunit [Candidatus Gastranaerophilales bacterium]